MSGIVLTDEQNSAHREVIDFILDPSRYEFILSGYAGTGKSTLLREIVQDIPKVMRTAKLIGGVSNAASCVLTATTNKAAHALEKITGQHTLTIQSFLGLRYDSRLKKLVKSRGCDHKKDMIIFVDEASYVDTVLLSFIRELTRQCKVIYVGDPAQLTPVKANKTPVFHEGIQETRLTKIVRQAAGNPVIELATAFRETVNSGQFFQFIPDQANIIHLPQDQFEQEILREMNRPDWKDHDSKVLAWTNKAVVAYNHDIRDSIQGAPQLQVGDIAVNNTYVQSPNARIATDQIVLIEDMTSCNEKNIPGFWVHLDMHNSGFMPIDMADRTRALKQATKDEDWAAVRQIENWLDLRAAYACTINKSQGSTYDKVFIDLNDVSKCNNGNLIARMLYVAVSRARHQVYLTGDFV